VVFNPAHGKPTYLALKLARKSVQKVLNPSAQIKTTYPILSDGYVVFCGVI
jgi:hypothetical protein